MLRLTSVKTHRDSWAGLMLTNTGLGPTIVINTVVRLDGKTIGKWESSIFEELAGSRTPRTGIQHTIQQQRPSGRRRTTINIYR